MKPTARPRFRTPWLTLLIGLVGLGSAVVVVHRLAAVENESAAATESGAELAQPFNRGIEGFDESTIESKLDGGGARRRNDLRQRCLAALRELKLSCEAHGDQQILQAISECLRRLELLAEQERPPYLLRSPENLGRSFDYVVTGAAGGTVWGSDIYTDDSDLATAAVHAGALKVGEMGAVRVTLLPGRHSYRGSTRNGVVSLDYANWQGSYVLERIDGGATIAVAPAPAVKPPLAPPSMSGVIGEIGQSFEYTVIGAAEGYVWGCDVYTDDSQLSTAAVHAGLLEPGETGAIRVTLLPGRSSYEGTQRRGVASLDYGPWARSYVLDEVAP
ncbi:MAG: LCCL domain-containing protein [Pirellulaceae bacterium]